MKVIILAGGSGTRLWPLSQSTHPKQCLHFGESFSLLQQTLRRCEALAPPQDIYIVTRQEFYPLIKEQACAIDPTYISQILVEPEPKNTAPAIAFAFKYLEDQKKCSKTECVLVTPSDHFMAPELPFLRKALQAKQLALKGHHILFGIHPTGPDTGYGYVQGIPLPHPDFWQVQHFVEKPNATTAQRYLEEGSYLWNAGIFVFQIDCFWQEMQQHCPDIGQFAHRSFQAMHKNFSEMPSLSIDYALMEKSKKSLIAPLDICWSDVGSWDNLYTILEKDEQKNVKMGRVIDINTKNSLILSHKRLIATLGISDLLIVETEEAVFIGKRGESQQIKALIEAMQRLNTPAAETLSIPVEVT